MSGGRFNYIDSSLKMEMFGWYDSEDGKIPNVLDDREISELAYDVLELIHDYDWYASGDTGEDAYLKAKAAFKKKWFGSNRGLRLKRITDEAVEDLRRELYEMFSTGPVETNGDSFRREFPEAEVYEHQESMEAVVVKFPKRWWNERK